MNYIINCGNNVEASGGVVGIWREADARVRGAKRVQVEPHLSITGAVSAQWVPIKPKTDAAFLFALIHRIVHERDWREVCDVPALEGSVELALSRRAERLVPARTRKRQAARLGRSPMAARSPMTIRASRIRRSTASTQSPGVEHGPDDDAHSTHAAGAGEALVPGVSRAHASRTRRSGRRANAMCPPRSSGRSPTSIVAHACVGQTIEIEGETLPFRPVAITLGKTVNNGLGGYHCCWARTMLAMLVGALEVPGGTLGTTVKLVRPAASRTGSVLPGPDGFMRFQFNATSKEDWLAKPHIRNSYKTLVPLVSDSPWSPALGPAHLSWLFQKETPDNWPRVKPPDMWFCYRTNPAISSWDAPEVAERLAEFPFIVAFAYTDDETNHFADVLLPESTDLESTQLIRIGSTKFQEQFWKHEGWAIRQSAGDKPFDTRDFTDIATALAERAGHPREVRRGDQPRRGRHGARRPQGPLRLQSRYDRGRPAARRGLGCGLQGRERRSYRRRGGARPRLVPRERLPAAPVSAAGVVSLSGDAAARSCDSSCPIRSASRATGASSRMRLGEIGVTWWEKQLEEYEFLPTYERFPDIWIEYAREYGKRPGGFPVLGAHRALDAVQLGRECRPAADQRGREQHLRPSRRHHQSHRPRASSASPRTIRW